MFEHASLIYRANMLLKHLYTTSETLRLNILMATQKVWRNYCRVVMLLGVLTFGQPRHVLFGKLGTVRSGYINATLEYREK